MKVLKNIGPVLAGCLLTLVVISQVAFKNNDDQLLWTPPAIPDDLSFAGEKAPLSRWDVREKFDKEFLNIYYSTGGILYLIKLANRNFPIISERLKANGVPDDFKYLCIAESNMQSWAVSKSGAVGYWQFLEGTANGFGLQTNAQIDERRNLEKSTDAACKYLKQAYAKFGNWTAAAASYNCGMGGYNSQAVFQKTNNYYDLMLPEETNKYILRILAFKYILENAGKLGFIVNDDEKYKDISTRTILVSTSLPDLTQFAKDNGTNYKILALLNPWIKGKSLTNTSGKIYAFKVPK